MHSNNTTTGLALRPYQHEAVNAVLAAFDRDVRRQLVVMPTGTGKTIVFSEVIRRRGGRALVLAHRDELIQQPVDKIPMVMPGAQVGIVKAERDETDAQIVVASVQTLSRPRRGDRLVADFSTIVVDEAHHAPADSYQRILERAGAFGDDAPLVLGVTATPERADGAPLGETWQEITYRVEMLPMIGAGYLSDIIAKRVHLEVDLDAVHTRCGDLVAGELDEAMRSANAPAHCRDAYLEHADGRKALVFTPSVALAHETATAFQQAGVAAEALDGTTDPDLRRAILRRLHAGETMVVCNCAVLTEGFDEPSLDCIIVARPTKSRGLYQQMIGRGTRPYPGKANLLVLDLVGSTRRHDLQSVAELFNLRPEELDGDATVTEAIGRRQALQAQRDAHGRLVSETVDLFHRRALHWVASGATRHALSIGEAGMVILRADDLVHWTVLHLDQARQSHALAAGIDLGYAQGIAEDFARKVGAGRLVDRAAPWRTAPASEGQLGILRRCRIPFAPDISKGDASDLITTMVARRVA
ncbi:MAG: DEAD/DEAH box helicase [Acidobacteria bacterium]|nr:DEAD/DEAH box helicase [Acidobacteriota bacterium]